MAEQPLILIVDDEANFREIFSAKLGVEGFRVETAENGQLGVEKVKKIKPSLVLMDVNMPVMDGPSAVLQLRADPATKDTKVAFLTSLGDPRMEMQEMNRKFSQDFGAQGYLKKTDDLDILVGQIKGFLK
ncbi:MAG TPA: response regulator [Candidatus Paceibacterota bacterium]|jgi:two-component system chemotaxis response regulator CheY|nr:response regulator [Candidatus Paceibacterota bacterium]